MNQIKKVCGPSKSKKYPNVYTKSELIKKAVKDLGLKKSELKSMNKEELCKLLKLETIKKIEKVNSKVEKICSTKRSIPRYTKKELEELAKEKNILKKDIVGKSYADLCKLLKIKTDQTINLPKTPIIKKNKENCIKRSEKTLKDYQTKVVKFMDNNRGLIVFHKVGSGKTLTAITVSQCYLDKYPQNRVIVITPAGLLNNFKDEMTSGYKNLNHLDRYEYYSIQGFVNASKRNEINCNKILLIIDEAHNLRTPPSKSVKKPKGINTKHILECAEQAHKVLLLTGTPLYNQVSDIRTLYDMIRNPSEHALAGKSYTNTFLFNKLKCKISYYDPENSDKFPKRETKMIPITMTKFYQKKYEEIVEDILGSGTGLAKTIFGDKNLEVFYNAIRRAVNNLDNSEENGKTTWVVDKIKNTPPNEKIIVFSNFLDAGMNLITQRLPNTIKYGIIRGNVSMKKRKEIVKQYNDNKIQVLFISKAGGEGLDLKGTRSIIIMDPSWNQSSIEQVIGRGIRFESHDHLPPSERIVTIYHLDHLLPNDTSSDTIKNIKKYLALVKKNPEMDMRELGKVPLDPYENSIDLYLIIYTKRKEIILNHFIEKIKKISIENC
jgi:SNF2 family DNA or RNA helicase